MMKTTDRSDGQVTDTQWIDFILAFFGPEVVMQEMQRKGMTSFYKVTCPTNSVNDLGPV